MYTLHKTYLTNEDGSLIQAEDLFYEPTNLIFLTEEEAEEERVKMCYNAKGIYYKVVKIG